MKIRKGLGAPPCGALKPKVLEGVERVKLVHKRIAGNKDVAGEYKISLYFVKQWVGAGAAPAASAAPRALTRPGRQRQ